MNRKLSFIVCNFLVPEFAEVFKNGDYSDVHLLSFPASCISSDRASCRIEKTMSNIDPEVSDVVLFCSNKLSFPEKTVKKYQPNVITLSQCFEPFINSSLLFHYISKGYYLATNGWIQQYGQHLKDWGFDREMAGKSFGESLKKILFMDTGLSGDYMPNLEAMSEYMQLPYEIIPIGLENTKSYVDAIVSKWRYEKEHRVLNSRIARVTRQSADNMVILSQLEDFVNLRVESDIINAGFGMIDLLFAPTAVRYQQNIDNKINEIELKSASEKQVFLEKNCFVINVASDSESLGKFFVDGVRFPEFLRQYIAMGKTIGQILSISISNARQYEVILDQSDKIATYSHELHRSNETKDQFFSIIAHDLRGPIGSALSLSELLLEQIEEQNLQGIAKKVSTVRNRLDDIFNLLNNLLEWAQSQRNSIKYNPQRFNLYETVDEVCKLLSAQAGKKKIFINIEMQKNFIVMADKAMLKTIFRNLISNAIKFSNLNGVVKVSAALNGKMVEISVKDFGSGMDARIVDRLFDMETDTLRRGTSGEKGTGLGLILVKEFLEKHDSKIDVESKIGEGSRFSFAIASGNIVL